MGVLARRGQNCVQLCAKGADVRGYHGEDHAGDMTIREGALKKPLVAHNTGARYQTNHVLGWVVSRPIICSTQVSALSYSFSQKIGPQD